MRTLFMTFDDEFLVMMIVQYHVFVMQWWLRALGARVGKNVCQLGVVGGIETDLKSIGDNVCLNFNAKPLSHSLEYHMLTFGKCTIQKGATIGCRSIVEMDAVVPEFSNIPPMTPVHAVKIVSTNTRRNLMDSQDMQRAYSVGLEGIIELDSGKDDEKDLEASDCVQNIQVTNQVYYMD